MNKSIIFVGAAIVMVGAFVIGKNLYKDQQAAKVSQVAATNSDSPFKRPDAPMIGTIMAQVEIVEFFDPACEACRGFHPYVKSVLNAHKNQVRLSLRYATLHRGSDYVAQVLEAARMQGLDIYLASLEAVLEGQPVWADHGRPQPELVWTLLKNTGLDIERARREMNDPKILTRLKQDAADMVKLDVRKTPTLFINGKPLREFSPEGLASQVASEIRIAYKP
jgi:protein-disulfide isomerase